MTFAAIRIGLQEKEFNFQNILVIDFGQLGDVVLSLPALRAVREKFADAKITLLLGKPSGEIARLAGVSDDRILVDRVALRDGNKAKSVLEMFRLARDVRRRKFDLVIDLHSLYETNLLGFLSGAKHRLFANRENRSIDLLSNYPIKPPREDKSLHHAERYFAVLKPLGIEKQDSNFRILPPPDELDRIAELYATLGVTKKHRVGLFLGAGHLGRRWGIDKFASLAHKLTAKSDIDVLVFLGPEEADLRQEAQQAMSAHAIVMPEMPLARFFAALGTLDAFVSTDTGPMHLAAVAGASIVLITAKGATKIFLPLTNELHIVDTDAFDRIGVDEVYEAVMDPLNKRGQI